MLLATYQNKLIEVGTDEAGRGCLAGPVFAAAVIFRKGYSNALLNDSKKLKESQRNLLRLQIENDALEFAVASISHKEIDSLNILNASIKAMHVALSKLKANFELIVVDGNRFKPFASKPYTTIVKGDGKYLHIAAASILAKTYRDEWMLEAHEKFPIYNWKQNKGYGTLAHRQAIIKYGQCPLHRKSFHLKEMQLGIFENRNITI